MASFNKFNLFVQSLVRKQHNLNSDTVKLALYTSAPVAADSVYAGTLAGGGAEVANGNGYTTGGKSDTTVSANVTGTETVRTATASPNPFIWTASSSGFSLRYVVAYNDTSTSDTLIGFWDYGSSLTLSGANGDTFTVTGLNTSIFTLA